MYVIKVGSAYFTGSGLVASQKDARRYDIADGVSDLQDDIAFLIPGARFVKLRPHPQSDYDRGYDTGFDDAMTDQDRAAESFDPSDWGA